MKCALLQNRTDFSWLLVNVGQDLDAPPMRPGVQEENNPPAVLPNIISAAAAGEANGNVILEAKHLVLTFLLILLKFSRYVL